MTLLEYIPIIVDKDPGLTQDILNLEQYYVSSLVIINKRMAEEQQQAQRRKKKKAEEERVDTPLPSPPPSPWAIHKPDKGISGGGSDALQEFLEV